MGTLNNLRPELKQTPGVHELSRIEIDFHNRMDAILKQQPVDRDQGQRVLLDFYRLTGSCGHGSV